MAWQNMAVENMVITEVVDKYGWKGLTTKNLWAAMNQVKDFLPWNGLTKSPTRPRDPSRVT